MHEPKKARVPLLLQIVIALVVGIAAGLVLGQHARPLGELGAFTVRLLKALATPLVFVAIVDSLMRASLPAKQGARLIVLSVVNAAVAGALAITLATVVKPGARVDAAQLSAKAAAAAKASEHAAKAARPAQMDFAAALGELIPESIAGPFVQNQVLAVVLLALFSGVALRRLRARGSGETIAKLVEEGFALVTLLLGWVIKLVPFAVFGVVANVVGTSGFAPFASLALLMATVAGGLVLHVALWYTTLIVMIARRRPGAFWRTSWEAILTALSTGSSMATLPVTLQTLEARLGVSRGSARLAACVGTNFNNDGIMLYEVAAALFVAQLHGIVLGPAQTALLAGTSALAAAGIAGVPEAGLITLSLVLTAAGLPLTELPLLLSVDWLLGRLRAATNVSSDLTIATTLDRWAEPESR
jgi:Na+/H+-dicarboxylate symporter